MILIAAKMIEGRISVSESDDLMNCNILAGKNSMCGSDVLPLRELVRCNKTGVISINSTVAFDSEFRNKLIELCDSEQTTARIESVGRIDVSKVCGLSCDVSIKDSVKEWVENFNALMGTNYKPDRVSKIGVRASAEQKEATSETSTRVTESLTSLAVTTEKPASGEAREFTETTLDLSKLEDFDESTRIVKRDTEEVDHNWVNRSLNRERDIVPSVPMEGDDTIIKDSTSTLLNDIGLKGYNLMSIRGANFKKPCGPNARLLDVKESWGKVKSSKYEVNTDGSKIMMKRLTNTRNFVGYEYIVKQTAYFLGSNKDQEGICSATVITTGLGAKNVKWKLEKGEFIDEINLSVPCPSACLCVMLSIQYWDCRSETTYILTVEDEEFTKFNDRQGFESICPLGATGRDVAMISLKEEDRGDKIMLCKDGSFSWQNIRPEEVKCSTITVYEKIVSCNPLAVEDSFCSAKIIEQGDDTVTVKISQSVNGLIHYTDQNKTNVAVCNKECEVVMPRGSSSAVRCTNNMLASVSSNARILSDCEWWVSHLSPKVASAVCRLSGKRGWVISLLLWPVFGYMVVGLTFILFAYLIVIIGFFFKRSVVRVAFTNTICQDCKTCVGIESLVDNHSLCWKKICPYCTQKIQTGFPEHVECCHAKQSVMNSAAHPYEKRRRNLERRIDNVVNVLWESKFWFMCYIIIYIILFTVPLASGDQSILRRKKVGTTDNFEIIKSQITHCRPSCPYLNGKCTCLKNEDSLREKRNSDFKEGTDADTIVKGLGIKRFTVLPGNLSIQGFDSERIVSLDVAEEVINGDQSVLRGTAFLSMPLEPNIGAIIKTRSKRSGGEVQTISLMIVDYQHKYSFRFKYWTSDRRLSTSGTWFCKGWCNDLCSCDEKLCYSLNIENALRSGCNIAWKCPVAVPQGCLCCRVYVKTPAVNHIWGVWETSFKGTEVVACLKDVDQKIYCFMLGEGKTVSFKNYKIEATKVFGTTTILPSRIVVKLKPPGESIDTSEIEEVFLDPSICYSSTCRHGEAGDFQYQDLDIVYNGDKMGKDSAHLDLTDVRSEPYCGSNWDEMWCKYLGMSSNNEHQFSNAENTSRKMSEEFYIHEWGINVDEEMRPKLTLDSRPISGSGLFEIKIEADGLVLQRETIKPKVSIFEVKECSGCKGCILESSCQIKIQLTEPDRYNLHVKSCDNLITVSSDTLTATTELITTNISFSTQYSLSEVCLCLEEVDVCSTTDKVTQWNMTSDLGLERGVVVSASIAVKGESSDTGFFGGIGSIFSKAWGLLGGVWSVLASIFQNFLSFLFIALIVVAAFFAFKFRRYITPIFSPVTSLICRRTKSLRLRVGREAKVRQGRLDGADNDDGSFSKAKKRIMDIANAYKTKYEKSIKQG